MKRKLKIEEEVREGVYPRRSIVPKVRLCGKWLQAAGLEPGAHVEVTVISRGVIELRICSPVQRSVDGSRVMSRLDAALERTK